MVYSVYLISFAQHNQSIRNIRSEHIILTITLIILLWNIVIITTILKGAQSCTGFANLQHIHDIYVYVKLGIRACLRLIK